MRDLLGTLAAALAFTLAAVGGAHAATELLFTIEGTYPTVIFELPANPTPSFVTPGSYFYFNQTPATVGGTAVTLYGLTFYNQVDSYNIEYTVGGSDTFLYGGQQIYAGSEASPMFIPGSFTLNGVNHVPDEETLTISEVPEPSTWAMMLIGFAGLVYAGFRSTRARGSIAA
jgi:PEP-CTERM motif-containing protein